MTRGMARARMPFSTVTSVEISSLIRQGFTVHIKGRVIIQEDGEGWFTAEIGDKTYRFHKSHVVAIDPRPIQSEDIVESTLAHRVDMTGYVVCVDGEQAWVRWDDGRNALESLTNLKRISRG